MLEDNQESGVPPPAEVPAGPASPPRTRRRRWVWVLAVLAAAGGIAAVALYWQEGPLRAARRELASGDARRALALASYFLETHPSHSGALAVKARALFATGQPQAAIELYERVGAATVEDLHAWAQAYLVQHQYSRALPVLTQIVRMAPDQADAWHELTGCRVRLGLLSEALESAERLAELPGQEARALVFRAAIQNDLGNVQGAFQAFERIVQLTPDGRGLQIPPEEFFVQYGAVLTNHGQSEAAIAWLEKSLAARPTAAAYFYLGNAHLQAGRPEAAEQAWQRSLDLDPAGVPTREALANQALTKRDPDRALKWLEPLERVAAKRSQTAYLFQRVYLLRKDAANTERWRKLVEQLRAREQRRELSEQLMLRSPHSFWANVARAQRFAEDGNWSQAEDMIKELAQEAPQDAFVRDLAEAIRQRGTLPPLERFPLKQH